MRKGRASKGDIVSWDDIKTGVPLTGEVKKLYERSVLVDISMAPNFRSTEMNDLTVVSHSRYAILKQ